MTLEYTNETGYPGAPAPLVVHATGGVGIFARMALGHRLEETGRGKLHQHVLTGGGGA